MHQGIVKITDWTLLYVNQEWYEHECKDENSQFTTAHFNLINNVEEPTIENNQFSKLKILRKL